MVKWWVVVPWVAWMVILGWFCNRVVVRVFVLCGEVVVVQLLRCV